VYNYVLH